MVGNSEKATKILKSGKITNKPGLFPKIDQKYMAQTTSYKNNSKKFLDINENTKQTDSTIFNGITQYIAYADNLAIVGRKQEDIGFTLRILAPKSGKSGLKMNENKTKYMISSQGSNFKYPGSLLNENNRNSLEIKEKIKAGNMTYIHFSATLSEVKHVKSKYIKEIHRTVIRSVVLHSLKYGKERYLEEYTVKYLYNKPRKGWLDEVEKDVRKLNVLQWENLVHNREEWRRIVKKA
ncbi:hypothetical protein CWI36_0885p0010 [Hamiltosporidium magnivora]|uniref:Reverse transcriptase domain-containing protein n=1 Tax=Hamiltosporidium magnivora TaxID=148818 RepID=A0A4Q9L8W0_9MICR|nr:hypothetical protein CWI36_0885p0010 [Hamiltosporidium magnivora]